MKYIVNLDIKYNIKTMINLLTCPTIPKFLREITVGNTSSMESVVS